MEFIVHSHRNALEIAESFKYKRDWIAFKDSIASITDEELKLAFKSLADRREGKKKAKQKSLSHAINEVLQKKLKSSGWECEPILFSKEQVGSDRHGWKLDFVKRNVVTTERRQACTFAVEVAFNHSEAAAWVLTKLALACEPTIMTKEIESKVGIIVVMQAGLKKAGNFDGACCTYSRYLHTINVMNDLLRAPLLVIGLDAPKSFKLVGKKNGVRIEGEISHR